MSVQGLKNITRALKAHRRATGKGVRAGLLKAGNFLQGESQKIVPVRDNILRPSATTRAEGRGFGAVVTVGYGTDYAVYVHEDLEARHKPGKSAKFLEKPAREKRGRMSELVVEGIEENRM